MRKFKGIMLVDDQPSDNFYNRFIIDSVGLCDFIVDYTSAVKALDFLSSNSEHEIDIIFLDINMPVMDGYEFLAEYAKLEPEHKALAVVVMLTSSINDKKASSVSNYGFVANFIPKPLTEESLIDTVNSLNI